MRSAPAEASPRGNVPKRGTLRGLIKTGAACALHWTRADGLLALRPSVRHMPLVLGYHRVVEDFRAAAAHSIPPMLISTRTFERQLDWIGHRFEFVTLDDLAAWTEGEKLFRRPAAAITFDDGYADLYRHAFPILKKKGIPAAVFVVTTRVGTTDLQTYDELYLLLLSAFSRWRQPRRSLVDLLFNLGIAMRVLKAVDRAAHDPLLATWTLIENLPEASMTRVIETLRAKFEIPESAVKDLRAMDWSTLRKISGSGVTVGSHTRTHARLTLETWKKVVDETRGSREDAEHALGMPVDYFSYPSGAFNAGVVRAVAEAGYRCAFTSCRHRDAQHSALTVPRRLWSENSCLDAFGRLSSAVMSCQVSGVFDSTSCGQTHSV